MKKLMKLFNTTIKISAHILFGIFGFLLSYFHVSAQVSTDALHIEEISGFNAYTAYISGNTPGVCLLANFYTETLTNARVRIAPYSTINNPTWTYNPIMFDVDPLEDALNASLGSNFQPGTEYIVQIVEVGPDGTYHLITPQNTTDDIQVVCTPNQDGTLNSSCPSNTVMVTNCSPDGVNQAQQNTGGQNIPGTASLENINPGENNVSFIVDTQSLEANNVFSIIYSSDIQAVNPNFTGPVQSTLFTSNGGNVPMTLDGLDINTTYYMTIIGQDGSIIINTDSNLPYESFTTGTQNGSGSNGNGSSNNGITGLGIAENINININGSFDQSELQGENIEQGFTQCGYGEVYDCGFNELLETIDRIIKFMLYVIVLPLAAILFAWSGIKLIIAKSQGKQSALSDAKGVFTQVLIGLVFAMGAWVIVKFILVILGYTDASGIITQILGISTQ